MYERVYYPLKPLSTTAVGTGVGDAERGGTGVVVDIDRTAGTPIVTLQSPLRVRLAHSLCVNLLVPYVCMCV